MKEQIKQYASIAAKISAAQVGLQDAKKELLMLMCKNCDLPFSAAEEMLRMMSETDKQC